MGEQHVRLYAGDWRSCHVTDLQLTFGFLFTVTTISGNIVVYLPNFGKRTY